jgi:very-short-patch-repair endonuclease
LDCRDKPGNDDKGVSRNCRWYKLGGLKFRRQHPIGNCIADFVCLEAKLIVEIDGKQHQESLTDADRTAALRGCGFGVIRFSNDQVRSDLDRVCDTILSVARSRQGTPHPTPSGPPSPTRGEG